MATEQRRNDYAWYQGPRVPGYQYALGSPGVPPSRQAVGAMPVTPTTAPNGAIPAIPGAIAPAAGNAAAGGYWQPTAWQTSQYTDLYGSPLPGSGTPQVMQQTWMPNQPATGAAGGFGGAGMPQWYGLEGSTIEGIQNRLVQQGMASASADFGRRGLMSSSMYGQAAATVGAQAADAAAQLTQAENARRTNWEFDLWRQQEANAQNSTRLALEAQQQELQRQQMRQQWDMYTGGLSAQSRQSMYDRYLNAAGSTKGAVPQQAGQQGGAGGLTGGTQYGGYAPTQAIPQWTGAQMQNLWGQQYLQNRQVSNRGEQFNPTSGVSLY